MLARFAPSTAPPVVFVVAAFDWAQTRKQVATMKILTDAKKRAADNQAILLQLQQQQEKEEEEDAAAAAAAAVAGARGEAMKANKLDDGEKGSSRRLRMNDEVVVSISAFARPRGARSILGRVRGFRAGRRAQEGGEEGDPVAAGGILSTAMSSASIVNDDDTKEEGDGAKAKSHVDAVEEVDEEEVCVELLDSLEDFQRLHGAEDDVAEMIINTCGLPASLEERGPMYWLPQAALSLEVFGPATQQQAWKFWRIGQNVTVQRGEQEAAVKIDHLAPNSDQPIRKEPRLPLFIPVCVCVQCVCP